MRFADAGQRPLRPAMGLDLAAPAVLILLWALLLALRWDALPLQLWDESRNAVNALEIAQHGRWLTPTYAGAVDHWNTKPPLMIWAVAALLKLGTPPLLAVRAPSLLAALGTTLMLWAALRGWAKDRFAALAAAVLLLSARSYLGVHAAGTGDYDAPESAAVVAYVLAAFAALETPNAAWAGAAAAALAIGMLTKGVAAALALPGVGLYALSRPGALAVLMRSRVAVAGAVAALAAVVGYYFAREIVDPGYLAVVAHNELGGRFLQVTEHHRGGLGFYLIQLWRGAEPAAACALASLVMLYAPQGPRRRLAAAAALALASLLVVLSASRSKMEWYTTPMIPFVALLGGLGLSRLAELARRLGPSGPAAVRVLACAGLAVGVVVAATWVRAAPARLFRSEMGPQFGYDTFVNDLLAHGERGPVTAIDGGLYNDAGFVDYHPMLRFDAALARARGLQIATARPEAELRPGTLALTCDPSVQEGWRERYRFAVRRRDARCLLIQVQADRGPAAGL